MRDIRHNAVCIRRSWLCELIVLAALMLGTLILFGLSDLDRELASLFYRPRNADSPWPYARMPIGRLVYRSAAFLTAALSLTALGGMAWGFMRRRQSHYRRYAVFVLLAVALGPGLAINGLLREHWGRPRPRQTEQFGGEYAHHHAHQPGPSRKCKSFPCGHSSVGFVFCVFYFLIRRSRRKTAFLALAVSILLGLVLGVARMADGGHFCSDVLWSGYIVFLVTWVLYYFVLRIPQAEKRRFETG